MAKPNGVAGRAMIPVVASILFLAIGVAAQPPAPSAPRVAQPAEQIAPGISAAPRLVASFDGLGHSFTGPQGQNFGRSPSDSSLAVGPNHIVQIVNSRMAVFTKKGAQFGETGRALYGPVGTNNLFRGFGGPCEQFANGDGVVRYDQLANRWLVVMPIFTRLPKRAVEPATPKAGDPPALSMPGRANQPGPAAVLFQPAAQPLEIAENGHVPPRQRGAAGDGSYAICYAVSTTPDPLGSWYRYEFVRPLFPDYPRPAVWPDGYYVPTSTGDTVIERHACVAEREKMLAGLPAREICLIVNDVNFLNNADVDGQALPPKGAPNIVVAAGGSQLRKKTEDDALYFWKYHVDWQRPERSTLTGPTRMPVAPYAYLCGGQLTRCVPQPRTDMKLDSQGDKITQRFVYRRIGSQESLVATHSVASSAGGGVRWYEVRLDGARDPVLYQQGTYAPDAGYRWLASMTMDKFGSIGIGYSFGDAETYVGQRFAGRLAGDPLGQLGVETVLVHGQASQTDTLRWEDYVTTATDPDDDCTMWYVGDYLRVGDASYSTKIGAFRLGQCGLGGS